MRLRATVTPTAGALCPFGKARLTSPPQSTMRPLSGSSLIPLMSWFLDAGKKEAPQAQLTGVQKAPRHEVAGSWAPAEQRALWRFNAAPGSMIGGMLTRFDLRVCPHGRSAECSGPCRRVSGGYQRAIYALMVLL